ncbi:MAG: hypothetical protein Q7V63_09370 [Gammaproteobacteria bacterium]|nr:hypothetical protein [Gammaproteobacteria bacterium]
MLGNTVINLSTGAGDREPFLILQPDGSTSLAIIMTIENLSPPFLQAPQPPRISEPPPSNPFYTVSVFKAMKCGGLTGLVIGGLGGIVTCAAEASATTIGTVIGAPICLGLILGYIHANTVRNNASTREASTP